jgi:hypothetical protein
VDCAAAIEAERLRYIRTHQHTLRAEVYQGVRDAVHAGDTNATHIGRRVILPSSFLGSPRHLHELYQDAMAIAREHGKPQLFITFTCNPAWPEITAALPAGEQPHNHPDVLTRVFELKKAALMRHLVHDAALGRTVAHIFTVEFQMRGLPHVHVLLWLAPHERPREPHDIDRLICAELPDPTSDAEAYSVVRDFMMHHPCGTLLAAGETAACMVRGQCHAHFPFDWCDATTESDNGYVLYRRRNTGITATIKGRVLDNRWVVPYNRRLLLKFRAHICVLYAASVRAIKYLHTYLYKGPDRADVSQHRRTLLHCIVARSAACNAKPSNHCSCELTSPFRVFAGRRNDHHRCACFSDQPRCGAVCAACG